MAGPGRRPFDLIISCDCLIYFGDLSPIVAAAARRLKPGGVFAMSMERGNRYPFHLTDTGRYTHHPDHVREAAAKAGLAVAQIERKLPAHGIWRRGDGPVCRCRSPAPA